MIVPASASIATWMPRASYRALRLAENAGQLELGEHAVEAVGRFLDIFQEQDAVLEVGQIARADDRREDGQVAAEESASRGAVVRRGHSLEAAPDSSLVPEHLRARERGRTREAPRDQRRLVTGT